MDQAKLFVSHSSKTDNARKLRDEVARSLDARPGITVLWDQNLEPGERWRAKLDGWLAECSGGVLLFSKDAIASNWVLKEAQILTWRKAVTRRFVLVPVLLAPVQSKQTRMDQWGPIKLGEIQFLKGGDPEALSAQGRKDLAAEIVQAVEAQIGPRTPEVGDDPLRDWLERLGDDLVGAGAARIQRAAKGVGVDLVADAPATGDPARWAQILSHRLLHFGAEPPVCVSDTESFETAVAEVKRLIRTFAPDAKKRVAREFFPVWVSPDAARHVVPIGSGRLGARILCINGTEPETGENYANRATCGRAGDQNAIIWVPDVHDGDPAEMIVTEYDRKLKQRFRLARTPPESWDQELSGILTRVGQVFVVLYGAGCSPRVLAPLLKSYQPFTFILMVGNKRPAQLRFDSGYPVIAPPLPDGRDRAVAALYEEIIGA